MEKERQLDARAIEESARASGTGEHFQELDRGTSFRIGVGTRMNPSERTAFFIEVIVNPCPGPGVDLSVMERNLTVLMELEARGYTMRLEDDGSIVCEVIVQPDEIDAEVGQVTEYLGRTDPSAH